MGQRHQAYVIARITPHGHPLGGPRYRCIAALDHQWCYRHFPLWAATRFITLIKQKENAEIIREEINNIHGLYGTFGTDPELPDVPCPFTHFLMHSAWTSDLNDPNDVYETSAAVLPAGMGTKEGGNNDGITVIDVSNPESPAYCFVSVSGLECGDSSDISTLTPLSATQYLRSYYPKPDSGTPDESEKELDESEEEFDESEEEFDESEKEFDESTEESVLGTLHAFESVPMITIDMLAEAWPSEYTPDPSGSWLEPKESIPVLPSLVVPALNHALQTGEIDCLDPFMSLPANLSTIKETLRARDLLSAIDFALLSKVIALEVTRTASVDLSHFSLTGKQLIELLSAHQGIEVLNLSHMIQITTDILRLLIPILPNLRRLVLLHTIADADMMSLLSESPELFYRIDSIIHFAFLRGLGKATFPAVFTHITTKEALRNQASIASLPYFTPGQLVQALTDYVCLLGLSLTSMIMSGELPLLTTYASTVRQPGRSWAERIVPFIPSKKSSTHQREGWFFAWLVPNPFVQFAAPTFALNPFVRSAAPFRYAFAKINQDVAEECRRRIDEFRKSLGEPDARSKNENSWANITLCDEEIYAKENDIKSEYADRKFHIFDVKSFFQELVKEGRPAPSPEALTNLLEIFAKRDNPLSLMTPADLRSFLENAGFK